MKRKFLRRLLVACLVAGFSVREIRAAAGPGVHKISDVVIYRDDQFYSAFPSIIRRRNGELVVAFRRAPERRVFGESGTHHTDPTSQLMLVRSRDDGDTWTRDPELIFADPYGGSQDPCLLQLRDGTLLCTTYGWALLDGKAAGNMKDISRLGDYAFLGGSILRSEDGGRHWSGPLRPPPVPDEPARDPFGRLIAAYNRGALCQGRDGRVMWVVAARTSGSGDRTENHLLTSSDTGRTWEYACPVARDSTITFNEASVYETPKGDLVTFIRTENFDDHTVMARSRDGGRSFEPWRDAGFQGHPHQVVRLPDNRALVIYGYRHKPFGIRARVFDAECERVPAEEIVLRDDGGNGDLGYPWGVVLSRHRVLVVYYFNRDNGTRHIAGTLLAVD